MELREIMTPGVVTAPSDADVLSVARSMRDHNVGSVVVCDPEGGPVGVVTDRDLAVRLLAEELEAAATPVKDVATHPVIAGEPEMQLEEAAARMVQHSIRRLPVLDDGALVGIVTLDDIAVRTGNLEVAQQMTQEVIEGALPDFFFHERG